LTFAIDTDPYVSNRHTSGAKSFLENEHMRVDELGIIPYM